ncbi:glycosyltransferase family 4 protein [Variovorax sp. OV329]|uniref:glycosyltransferase family 4 protein n=1 Tax=Variovorax sp. OV329 TaxID=1882825 RepID=UPI0008E020AC|nr:glycosyltransferase family 4 protein [Variovorax sp. OV329]SFN06927.1 Glycosyltransferase involved in cell wall bisynthesis [Variovorax sp. OV329]
MNMRLIGFVKGLYWMITPWWLRERVQARRIRGAQAASLASLVPWTEIERVRVAARARGEVIPAPASIDWFDDASVCSAVGSTPPDLFWPALQPCDVTDTASGARYLVDLWRRRTDLRERFPDALSEGSAGAFGQWLQADGAVELGIAAPVLPRLVAALDARLADKPRQAFLANLHLASIFPHGLTPAGSAAIFKWFVLVGRQQARLSMEEVWWLFLDAAAHPERELLASWSFAPAWQSRHPDGTTVFGCWEFAAWFRTEYGVDGPWTDPVRWPIVESPAVQIRIAYESRAHWRTTHPQALDEPAAAAALLAWLASPEAGLPEANRGWCRELDASVVSGELTQAGFNLLGHFCYPSGLRISIESMADSMRSAGTPISERDMVTDVKDDPHHARFGGTEVYDTTVIHVQPDPYFTSAFERAQLAPRKQRTYRVAYWYWEFAQIPDLWVAKARQVDEVWAATEFVAQGLRERLKVPVRTLFPGVKLAPFEKRSKSSFGLDEAPYTFLFTFHMMSVMERKNPLGLIRAFRKAFTAADNACLVLKTSYGERYPEQIRELREAAKGANIRIIDEVYSPDAVLALIEACDAYVSLHRSEGLGLTMAEAMLLGKPVIATNFSGNVDFMNQSNSLLVDYKLKRLGWPIPPYDAHLQWAEPSEDHAAAHMRRLYDDQPGARELGLRGKASAEASLSLQAAGQRFAARLAEIEALRKERKN